MAVQEQTPQIEYVANGVTKSFPLTFDCEDQDHLIVTVNDAELSVGSWMLIDENVSFKVAPANGNNIVIQRNTPLQRTTTYKTYNNSFRPEVVNEDLDHIIRILQEQGYADSQLTNELAQEIYERSLQNSELKGEIDNHSLSLTTIQKIQDEEAHKRMAGDREVAKSSRDYTDFMLRANNTDPQFFTGVADNIVITEDGSSQREINRGQLEINNFMLQGIQSVDDLREFRPLYVGHKVELVSVNKDQNEGGGTFIAARKNGLVDDGGVIISSPLSAFYWVRINYDVVTPEMFGAKGYSDLQNTSSIVGLVDSYSALQKSFKHSAPLTLSERSYIHSKPLVVSAGKKITGSGHDKTQLLKSTHAKSGLPSLKNPSDSRLIDYDVDASIILFNESGGYVSNTDLSGFKISYGGSAYVENNNQYTGYGIHAPLSSESMYKNIKCFGYEFPFYTSNSWMLTLERVHAHGLNGFTLGGRGESDTPGTTTIMTGCWSTATGADRFAYNFNRMWQVVMNGIAAEYVGDGGNPAQGIFNITKSYVVVKGLDIEQAHIKQFIKSSESTVSIESVNSYLTYANYADKDTYLFDISWGRCDVKNCVISLLKVDSTKTSNFARLHGNVDFSFKTSATEPEISSAFNTNYTSESGDFVVYATENSFYDVDLRNGKTLTNRRIDSSGSFDQAVSVVEKSINDLRSSKTRDAFVLQSVADSPKPNNFGVIYNLSNANSELKKNNSFQMFFGLTGEAFAGYRSALYDSEFGGWTLFRTSANTTVTADGTIKSASPIVKLFSDRIECNAKAAEQKPVFEKISIGHYLVKNTSGFSSDGWWIDVPHDSNGNKICAVEYQTLENSDLEIKTFKRKFDYDTASIVADFDNPIDIPKNSNNQQRWIDIRLNEIKEIGVL